LAGLDRSSYDAGLKEFYLPPFREQANTATVLLDQLDTKADVQVEGRNYIVPLVAKKHKGVTSRSGATKSANKLPTASRQTYEVASFAMKYHYGRIEIDGPTMRSSKSDSGSFARAVDIEMRGLSETMPMDLNRQLFGDGVNTLATCASTVTTSKTHYVDTTKFLEVGQIVTPYLLTSGTPATITSTVLTVESITDATTVVLSVSVTLTTTTYGLFSEADQTVTTATPVRNGMSGLMAMCITSNVTFMGASLGNIDRSTAGNEFWHGNHLHNSGTLRSLTIGLMQQGMMESGKNKFGGKEPNLIVTNPNLWATLGALLVADKRFDGATKTLDGGWTALYMNGVPIVYDRMAPDDKFFFLVKDHIFFLQQNDYDWMDEDGSVWFRVSDYDSYEATLYCDKELGTDLPAALTLLDDIDVNLG
jgi:hypothetical protein